MSRLRLPQQTNQLFRNDEEGVTDMTDDQFAQLMVKLESLSDNVERLAVAIERQNEFGQKLMRCPRCLGDGKDYGSKRRCVGCGGTGTRK
jgi:hypothetical protein